MIVVDHDDQRVGSAVLTEAFKCTKNVYGIEDVIETNVFFAAIGDGFLMLAPRFTDCIQGVRAPAFRSTNLSAGGVHRLPPGLACTAFRWDLASVIPGSNCKAAT